jgi:hypothetical protein
MNLIVLKRNSVILGLKFLLIVVVISMFSTKASAQGERFLGGSERGETVTLYVSKQTKNKTSIGGSYNKSSDEFEKGSCELSKEGPIVYTIAPAPSYGPNQSITWDGLAHPDLNNIPAPGTTVPAKIIGDYSVFYSVPGQQSDGEQRSCDAYYIDVNGVAHDPHGCQGVHTIINNSGSGIINYDIVSIKIDLPKETSCNDNNTIIFFANEIYPGDGDVEWFIPWLPGSMHGSEAVVEYKQEYEGKKIVAKYVIDGVDYYDTTTVKSILPSVEFIEKIKCENGRAKIVVKVTPEYDEAYSSVNWTFPNGVTGTCSGPTCNIELSPLFKEDFVEIKVSYTYRCNTSDEIKGSLQLAKLLDFELPGCIDTIYKVEDIAILKWDDGPCRPKVIFIPDSVGFTMSTISIEGEGKDGIPIGENIELNPEAGGSFEIPTSLPVKKFTVVATARSATFTASTTAVDDDWKVDINNKIVDDVKSVYTKIKDVLNKIKQLTSSIPELPASVPAPKLTINTPKIDGSVGVNGWLDCCQDKDIKLSGSLYADYSLAAGLTAKLPIPIPMVPPPVAIGFIQGTAELSFGLRGEIIWNCPPPYTGCITGKIASKASLELGVEILSGFIEVSAGVSGEILAGNLNVCIDYPPPGFKGNLSLTSGPIGILGSVKGLWGLVSKPFEVDDIIPQAVLYNVEFKS